MRCSWSTACTIKTANRTWAHRRSCVARARAWLTVSSWSKGPTTMASCLLRHISRASPTRVAASHLSFRSASLACQRDSCAVGEAHARRDSRNTPTHRGDLAVQRGHDFNTRQLTDATVVTVILSPTLRCAVAFPEFVGRRLVLSARRPPNRSSRLRRPPPDPPGRYLGTRPQRRAVPTTRGVNASRTYY